MTRKHKGAGAVPLPRQGRHGDHRRGAAVATMPPTSTSPAGRPSGMGRSAPALLSGADARSAAVSNWFWTALRHDRPAPAFIHPDDETDPGRTPAWQD